MPLISSPEDNGNIVVLNSDNNNNISLEIRGDNNRPDFFQWFNFNLKGNVGEHYVINIENANRVKYPEWNLYEPYKTYASYGNDEWFTLDTVYCEQSGKLTMNLILTQDEIQIAFFPPYNYERHLFLIKYARMIPHCNVSTLGKTNGEDGRDITLLTFGKPSININAKKIWLIARQHPGEPQAEWFAEEIIKTLVDRPELFEKYTFFIVPNMNPDGTYYGNLRTNKEGKDLNRMWQNPTIEDSPEVYYVLQKMRETGVDFFMDIHSDEIIPKPFLDEAHPSCPVIDKVLEDQEHDFMNLYIAHNPDMQNELNYGEKDRNDSVNMTLAAMAVGSEFRCPAFTLEMPTKSWSLQQCKSLAEDYLKVLDIFYLQLINKQNNNIETPVKLKSPGNFSMLKKTKSIPSTSSTLGTILEDEDTESMVPR